MCQDACTSTARYWYQNCVHSVSASMENHEVRVVSVIDVLLECVVVPQAMLRGCGCTSEISSFHNCQRERKLLILAESLSVLGSYK